MTKVITKRTETGNKSHQPVSEFLKHVSSTVSLDEDESNLDKPVPTSDIKKSENKNHSIKNKLSRFTERSKKVSIFSSGSNKKKERKNSNLSNSFVSSSQIQNKPSWLVESEANIPNYEEMMNQTKKREESVCSAHDEENIFKMNIEYSLRNIKLKIDSRQRRARVQKMEILRQINVLFVKILQDLKNSIFRMDHVTKEEVLAEHFQNLFDLENQDMTFNGNYCLVR